MEYSGSAYNYDELYHHGVKGQKWGVRRYQKEDGSLTLQGKYHVRTETRNAKYILKKEEKEASKVVKKNLKEHNKALDKVGQALAKGDQKRAEKFTAKAGYYAKIGKAAEQKMWNAQDLLKDIDDKKIMAGRDFTATIKTYVIPTPIGFFAQTKKDFHMYSKEEKEKLRAKGKLIE